MKKLALLLISTTLLLAIVGCGNKEETKKETTTTTAKPKLELPLTGELVDKTPDRSIMVVKIGNNPEARPQTGLNEADIVFEEVVEGGITRYVGIFHSESQDLIGPLRSVRAMDPNIAKLFGGIFVYSGGTIPNENAIQGTKGIIPLNETSGQTALIRTKDRSAPNNLYVESDKMWELGKSKGSTEAKALFKYSDDSLGDGTPFQSVTIPYLQGFQATFTDSNGKLIKSSTNGPLKDNNGKEITPANVVIMSISYPSYSEGVVVGSGPIWVFSNGKYVKGTWSRPSSDASMKLLDSTGSEISLSRGQTFVELMPNTLTPQIA